MFHSLESCRNHSLLPAPFADLDLLAEKWSLATQNQREACRRASTPAEIRRLYDTLLPRMDAILDYLNQFTLDTRRRGPTVNVSDVFPCRSRALCGMLWEQSLGAG